MRWDELVECRKKVIDAVLLQDLPLMKEIPRAGKRSEKEQR